jgi:hypothetical protein
MAVQPGYCPQLDLYWVPLGAGARLVRASGTIYEALSAGRQRRTRQALYHSALVAQTEKGRYFLEMAPVPDSHGIRRGVVAEGPVGLRALGRFRVFRYELRRWLDGEIPDLRYAVASPVPISRDGPAIDEVLELLPLVPRSTWGRDEMRTGEMWNSNSVVSWLLARTGLLAAAGQPPRRGRAPGWGAGIVAAKRSPTGDRTIRPGAEPSTQPN